MKEVSRRVGEVKGERKRIVTERGGREKEQSGKGRNGEREKEMGNEE